MSVRTFIAALALVTLSSSLAAAQPVEESEAPNDPDKALMLSVGGTAASVALVGAGYAFGKAGGNRDVASGLMGVGGASLFVTPALGHKYGRDRLLTLGTSMRAASLVTAAGSFALGATAFDRDSDNINEARLYVGIGGLIASAGLFVAGTAHDIATVKRETRRYNASHGLNVQLAPTIVSTRQGVAPAVGLVGSF